MTEGKLMEMKCELHNVPVEIKECDGRRVMIYLCDPHTVFVEADCSPTREDWTEFDKPRIVHSYMYLEDQEEKVIDSSFSEDMSSALADALVQNS